MGKTHIEFTVELGERFNGFALPRCRYNGYLKIEFTRSMLILQFDVWITSQIKKLTNFCRFFRKLRHNDVIAQAL